MNKQAFSYRRERQLCTAGQAALSFLDSRGGKASRRLAALWRNWRTVMGAHLADLSFPLGHKDDALIVGAEDSMALQELSLQSAEILERVNAFMDMDGDFFQRVRVVLMQGQQDLSRVIPRFSTAVLRPCLPPKPQRLGALLGKLNPESPVARCYAIYVATYAAER